MDAGRILRRLILVVLVLALASALGPALAQEPTGSDPALAVDLGDVPAVVPIQGRLLDSSGNPINGTRSVVFTLYSAATGGTVKCTDTQDVTAVNGLFNAAMRNCTSLVFDGRELWLGIKVGSDAEMTPRQPIYAVPYAWSLRPGAYIDEVSEELGTGLTIHTRGEGSTALSLGSLGQYSKGLSVGVGGEVGSTAVKARAGGAYSYAGHFTNDGNGIGIYVSTAADWLAGPALKAEATDATGIALHALATSSKVAAIVQNNGSGIGLQAISAGTGLSGPALKAEAKNAGGIAVRAVVTSTDASAVVENLGSGALLKGFGGDGGHDEIRINNDGSIETKADSYVFVPAITAQVGAAPVGAVLTYPSTGKLGVRVNGIGAVEIRIPVSLPGVLYGQPVKIEEVTVFYQTTNAASIITLTSLRKLTAAGDDVSVATSFADYSSTTWSQYSLAPTANNVLSASEGLLTLTLTLDFASASHTIYLGGARVRLGHHHLY